MDSQGLCRRFSEFTQDGNTLTGIAIRYNELANIGSFQERIVPGAFGDLANQDIILNLQHNREKPIARTGGGGLELIDTDTSLQIRANLNPDFASRAIAMVKAKILRGLSVEFLPIQKAIENSVTVIRKAKLVGIGLVDKPAYSGSIVQVRASSFRSNIPYGVTLGCECVSGNCTHAILTGESFIDIDAIIANRIKPDGSDVTAFVADYSNTVGSLKDGTLRMEQDANGLTVEIPRLPNTSAVNDLIETSAVAGVLARPYFKEQGSESVEETDSEGNQVLRVKGANLRGIVLGSTDRSDGWTAGQFLPIQDTRRSRKVWL